jgi:hypothetical protein
LAKLPRTGSSLDTCSPTNGPELFAIASVASVSNSPVPLISLVANAAHDNPLIARNAWE